MREAVPRRLNLCPVKCHRHCHVQFLNILTTACTRGDEHGCAVAWMQDDNNQAIIGWSADDRPRFQRKHPSDPTVTQPGLARSNGHAGRLINWCTACESESASIQALPQCPKNERCNDHDGREQCDRGCNDDRCRVQLHAIKAAHWGKPRIYKEVLMYLRNVQARDRKHWSRLMRNS